MLQINYTNKRKKLSEHMITQLGPFDRSEINTMIILLLVGWLDLFCLIGFIFNQSFIVAFDLPFVILLAWMHGWGLRILIKSHYAIQKEALYFIAILSSLALYGSFLWVMKHLYDQFDVSLWIAFLLTACYFLIWIVFFGQYHLRKYATKYFKARKHKVWFGLMVLAIALFPGTGYNNMQKVVHGHPWEKQLLLLFYAGLGIFFTNIAVLYVHKLLYVEKNRTLFSYKEPTAKEKKRMKAKGEKLVIK